MAMYNKYQGNSGRVQRVEDGRQSFRSTKMHQDRTKTPQHEGKKTIPAEPSETRPPSPLSGLSGGLGRMLGKLGSLSLETEDLLLILILYLMYRESGDQDFLIMIGAFLVL